MADGANDDDIVDDDPWMTISTREEDGSHGNVSRS
jgi:hypothetical protein